MITDGNNYTKIAYLLMQACQAASSSSMVCRSAGGAHVRTLFQNAMASSSVMSNVIANRIQFSIGHGASADKTKNKIRNRGEA